MIGGVIRRGKKDKIVNKNGSYEKHIYALIMAGGGGTRMWPKSRNATPKQFLKLFDGKTLMQITAERLNAFLPWEKIFVVTVSDAYKKEILKEVSKIPSKNIIVEPQRRDSAPAHGLGALFLYKKDKDAVIINSAADHLISPTRTYVNTVKVAAEAAYSGDYLVAVGIEPDYPSTGYGYIKRGKRDSLVQDRVVYELDKFDEKPPIGIAKRFLHSGKYYWNANQYVWRADTILKAIKKHAPKISKRLEIIEDHIGTKKQDEVVKKEYKKMPKISIDYAVSEKADNFLLVPAKYEWTDVGDWNEVWKHMDKDKNSNVIIDGKEPGGRVINIDTSDAIIHTDGRLIAIIDVDDVAVVDMKDALLICKKSKAQNVKKVVNQLREEKKKELL
jgi:mannose-1-phosphate guanylyltransferase